MNKADISKRKKKKKKKKADKLHFKFTTSSPHENKLDYMSYGAHDVVSQGGGARCAYFKAIREST